MSRTRSRRFFLAALALLPAAALAQPLVSYGLVLLETPSRRQAGALLRARIVDGAGQGLSNAVLVSARLDRAGVDSAFGIAPVTAAPGGEYGVLGFRADVMMDGDYTLSVVFQPTPGAPQVAATANFTVGARPSRSSGGQTP